MSLSGAQRLQKLPELYEHWEGKCLKTADLERTRRPISPHYCCGVFHISVEEEPHSDNVLNLKW